MKGFFGVVKPPFMSSFDVIRVLRGYAERQKMGHTGTLDYLGVGVLVIAVGSATRLMEFYMRDKKYRAEITLGIATDTHDAEGKVLEDRVAGSPIFAFQELDLALRAYEGELDQVPPSVSAKKHEGQRAYELARRGIAVTLPAQRVTISAIRLLRLSATKPQRVLLDVQCTTGTYLRAVARDLGAQLGCGAYLSFLVRTFSYPFGLDDCVTLDDIQREGSIAPFLKPMDVGLSDFPCLIVTDRDANRIRGGQKYRLTQDNPATHWRLYSSAGELFAIAVRQGNYLFPRKVLGS
ncbi:MAG: tRNA pseudouridine(55) synthase TruB [bacterium]